MDWNLGKFIIETLEKRGGRRAGWTQTRLAEITKLSTSHISWIITGENTGKKGPPDIRLETLIALAKGLGVTEQTLIDAYKGKNPEIPSTPVEISEQAIQEMLLVLSKHSPPESFANALIATNGAALEETKKRLKQGE